MVKTRKQSHIWISNDVAAIEQVRHKFVQVFVSSVGRKAHVEEAVSNLHQSFFKIMIDEDS